MQLYLKVLVFPETAAWAQIVPICAPWYLDPSCLVLGFRAFGGQMFSGFCILITAGMFDAGGLENIHTTDQGLGFRV